MQFNYGCISTKFSIRGMIDNQAQFAIQFINFTGQTCPN